MIAGVLFDKDGTLFDFKQSWGRWTRGMLAEFSLNDMHAEEMAGALSFDLETNTFGPNSPVVWATSNEIAEAVKPFLPLISLEDLVQRMNLLAVDAEMTPAVPLRPLFLDLKGRGLRIGLATNDVEAAARAHLAANGIADLFDFVAGSDSGHGAKPEPGMLNAFAADQNLAPSKILMVGDSRHDLQAGRAAGMRPIGVLTGPADADDLRPLAEAVLENIGCLPGWIDVQQGR
jgi:phosphoglycolate phosphatase